MNLNASERLDKKELLRAPRRRGARDAEEAAGAEVVCEQACPVAQGKREVRRGGHAVALTHGTAPTAQHDIRARNRDGRKL